MIIPPPPLVFRVRQHFTGPEVTDLAAEVRNELSKLPLRDRVRPGDSVAITAGSRGISGIPVILRACVEYFRQAGAEPFIVPAMGSHGGSTAEGQLGVLETLGITEGAVGCPIRATMDTVVVCQTPEGLPIHCDRFAYEARHVLVVGRIKPHTAFAGRYESGLMKMLLIGLGKAVGAAAYHRAAQDSDFDHVVEQVAGSVIDRCQIVGGLAIIENAFDRTAKIEALAPGDFAVREPELLGLARQWMARLPFDDVDVLLVDRIGKEISGSGLDPNVTGRKFDEHKPVAGETPRVKRICLRSLSAATHGNAFGMGSAEFCRSQLLRQCDVQTTRINAIASNHIAAAMWPLDYETDREMLGMAQSTVSASAADRVRLLWIADTLHLEEVACSSAYLEEASRRTDLEVLTPPHSLPFDNQGNLPRALADWR